MRKLLVFASLFLIICLSCYSNDYFNESSGLLFGFYHNYMSPLKSPVSKCQFEPSCSEYSKQSINEYGLTIGVILTADRLIRCSGGNADYEDYPYYNRKFFDRPQNNSLFGDGRKWSLGFSSGSGSKAHFKIDSTFNFAKHLYDKGELQLSKLELMRIQYYTDNSLIKEKINLLLAINEFFSNKGIKSLDYLSDIDKIDNTELKNNYFLLTYLISDFQNLNTYCANLCKKYIDTNNYLVNKKLLAYSYYKDSELDSSIVEINNLSILMRSSVLDTVPNYLTKNYCYSVKSPFLAGLMSAIIPGTGYLYAGRLKEGLSALIINGLLGAGIYSLFKNNNTGSGILTAMVTIPFYFGNIVGAANAAEDLNNKYQQIVLSNLRNALEISLVFSAEQFDSFWK
jgi:putative component of membrane protein insertase Oxa1/YidC/SpoIIIJ protein YidD